MDQKRGKEKGREGEKGRGEGGEEGDYDDDC